jgi:excisionase family DNA binding protein
MNLIESIAARKTAFKVEELAETLNCSKEKLYDLVKAGRIPYFRLGSMIRFDPKEISKWLKDKSILKENIR